MRGAYTAPCGCTLFRKVVNVERMMGVCVRGFCAKNFPSLSQQRLTSCSYTGTVCCNTSRTRVFRIMNTLLAA